MAYQENADLARTNTVQNCKWYNLLINNAIILLISKNQQSSTPVRKVNAMAQILLVCLLNYFDKDNDQSARLKATHPIYCLSYGADQ